MIGVIDCGMGNLRSVLNAIEYLGFEGILLKEPALLAECDRVILPGVGAYAKAMGNLQARGFVPAIQSYAAANKPILGICLGMQLLSTTGHEPYRCDGLNIIPGEVVPMAVKTTTALPHVGWNSVRLLREHPLFAGVRRDIDFYFVHSYCFQASSVQDTLGVTEYDISFTAVVARGNVLGLQFHPEKSQVAGLRILENFCQWDGTC